VVGGQRSEVIKDHDMFHELRNLKARSVNSEFTEKSSSDSSAFYFTPFCMDGKLFY